MSNQNNENDSDDDGETLIVVDISDPTSVRKLLDRVHKRTGTDESNSYAVSNVNASSNDAAKVREKPAKQWKESKRNYFKATLEPVTLKPLDPNTDLRLESRTRQSPTKNKLFFDQVAEKTPSGAENTSSSMTPPKKPNAKQQHSVHMKSLFNTVVKTEPSVVVENAFLSTMPPPKPSTQQDSKIGKALSTLKTEPSAVNAAHTSSSMTLSTDEPLVNATLRNKNMAVEKGLLNSNSVVENSHSASNKVDALVSSVVSSNSSSKSASNTLQIPSHLSCDPDVLVLLEKLQAKNERKQAKKLTKKRKADEEKLALMKRLNETIDENDEDSSEDDNNNSK